VEYAGLQLALVKNRLNKARLNHATRSQTVGDARSWSETDGVALRCTEILEAWSCKCPSNRWSCFAPAWSSNWLSTCPSIRWPCFRAEVV